jgi:hypothetical protein
MSTGKTVHKGSCFCGRVTYEIKGKIGPMSHCHCTDCRKSHAAAFATYIDVPRDGFTFLKGEDQIQTYKAPSGTKRSFCRTCGSILTCWGDGEKKFLEISASTLDTPTDLKPVSHGFVRSKASWYDILDRAPQYQTYEEA